MALFVYASEAVKADARQKGVSLDKVDDFCKEVEAAQSTSTFDRFPPPYLTRKRKWDYNNRLIAAEHSVGDHLVVVLLRLVVKSSRDYQVEFTNDPHSYADPLLRKEIPLVEAWLRQRLEATAPPELPKTSHEQKAFLWAEVGTTSEGDVIVCETQQWIQASAEARLKDRLIFLPDLIIELASGEDSTPKIATLSADPKLRVAYSWMPAEGQLLLLDVAYDRELDASARYAECTARKEGDRDFDILRITRRSYPLEVCCEPDMWLAIQRDAASNMALSPEESRILRSVRMTNAQGGFPLFINGRAGSGKSTLLQYLFADYFTAWAAHLHAGGADSETVPLYLAASKDLLTNAKAAVRGLLSVNAERVTKGQRVAEALLPAIDSAFLTPMGFLTRQVKALDKTLSFDRTLYVNYPVFRKLWLEQFGRDRSAVRDFGPQLCWHVIRTHIKGQSADSELEPEDFASLPRGEQTISQSRYGLVYQRFWKAWYEPLCKEQHLWDDQDLAALVTAKSFQGKHCAVFCDEAQDFTRRQLEALHRGCGFSFVNLTPDEATRVPFVFAGDPFQTLNPTGFRWEAIRAAFTEKIAGNLNRYKRRAHIPEINYQELTYNYRSTRHVVKLCNSIQAVRSIVMKEDSLRPQTTWHLDISAPLPVFFHPNEATVREAIRKQTDLVLIVPCEEDGESEYVEEHEEIKAIVRRDADGIPQNVLSPARAKGLEFNRVAVVGFGSAPEAAGLAKCLADPPHLNELTPDELLPIEYFLNKLYVACSRARRRLFIIDDLTELQRLWGFALEHDKLQALCSQLSAADVWRESAGVIAKGLPEHWQDDHNDPLETAARYEADGEAKRDPYLLLQAALQYEQAGDKSKTADCRGRAYAYDGKPERAGESFRIAGNNARALECFWEAEAFQRVVDTAMVDPTLRGRVEYRLATFLCNEKNEETDAGALLRELVNLAESDMAFRRKLNDKGWARAVRSLLERSSKSLRQTNDVTRWTALTTLHHELASYGVTVEGDLKAESLFEAGSYAEVVELLRSKPNSDLYLRAKVVVLQREREAGRAGKIGIDDKRIVGDMLRSQGKCEEAIWWYLEAGSREGLENCFKEMADNSRKRLPQVAVEALAKVAIRNDDWDYLIDLVDGKGWRGASNREATLLKQICEKADIARREIVPAVAQSTSVHRAGPSIRDRLLPRIRGWYRRPESDWTAEKVREFRAFGAAIEKVGKDIDALEFYERVTEDKAVPPELQDYANRRWAQCKIRQESRERSLDRIAQADRYKEQFEGRLRTFGWSAQDVGPEFPSKILVERGYDSSSVKSPKPTAQPMESQELDRMTEDSWHVGNLTLRYFRTGNRINIESNIGEQARIDLIQQTLASSEAIVQQEPDGSWSVPSWTLTVRFQLRGTPLVRVGIEERNVGKDGFERKT